MKREAAERWRSAAATQGLQTVPRFAAKLSPARKLRFERLTSVVDEEAWADAAHASLVAQRRVQRPGPRIHSEATKLCLRACAKQPIRQDAMAAPQVLVVAIVTVVMDLHLPSIASIPRVHSMMKSAACKHQIGSVTAMAESRPEVAYASLAARRWQYRQQKTHQEATQRPSRAGV